MTPGRLIAVVGPSGVGKDSVMLGIHQAMPDVHLVRRVITRPAAAGGEKFDAVTETEFADLAANGAFDAQVGVSLPASVPPVDAEFVVVAFLPGLVFHQHVEAHDVVDVELEDQYVEGEVEVIDHAKGEAFAGGQERRQVGRR